MKSSRVLLSCLLSIVFASAASAAWVPLTDSVPLSALPGGSLSFRNIEFSEFVLTGYGSGGADPDLDQMSVQGVQDVATGDYGLRFNEFAWYAGSGETVTVDLRFKVSILPGFDDYFIEDVWLNITGASANGTGGVHVGETVWDAPFFDPEGNIIASLSCSKQDGDSGAYLVAHAEAEFDPPLKEIWIQSKDISVTGGTSGTAHFSEFYQFYSQIPEPTTVVLLATAGVWILTRRKRSA